jgi:capsid protein
MAVTASEIAAALGVSVEALSGALGYANLSSARAKVNAELENLVADRQAAIAAFDAQITAKRLELAAADEALRQGISGQG